jgi:pimeloyl-ACP methyl ester carboxylesterase
MTPRDFNSLADLKRNVMACQARYQRAAKPFRWTFTRRDPQALLITLRQRPPAPAIADFRGLWPAAPVIELPGAGHYLQEDAPEIVVPLVQAFLAVVDQAGSPG